MITGHERDLHKRWTQSPPAILNNKGDETVNWSKLDPLRTVLLSLIGFALLAVGAFQFTTWLGLIVTGVEVLLFAYLTDTGPGAQDQARR